MTSKGKYTVNLFLSSVVALGLLGGCSSEPAYHTALEAIESLDHIREIETPVDI